MACNMKGIKDTVYWSQDVYCWIIVSDVKYYSQDFSYLWLSSGKKTLKAIAWSRVLNQGAPKATSDPERNFSTLFTIWLHVIWLRLTGFGLYRMQWGLLKLLFIPFLTPAFCCGDRSRSGGALVLLTGASKYCHPRYCLWMDPFLKWVIGIKWDVCYKVMLVQSCIVLGFLFFVPCLVCFFFIKMTYSIIPFL